MDNVLDLEDQAAFGIALVSGVTTDLQCVWVYNRPVDIEGLRQFHAHLQRGRLSRGIERSPLRFGRHRWVSADRFSAMEIVAEARPRAQFDAWLDEQANNPLDCEHGPGWHLAVMPFTDGGAGVSLVVSHSLIDGVGLGEALTDAVLGRQDPISWPAPRSRRRWKALRQDARQSARDIRAIGPGMAAASRLTRQGREVAKAAAPLAAKPLKVPAGAGEFISLPTATVFVKADEWEARAQALGGTSNALLVGVAARLAQRAERVTADGLVVVRMPFSERVAGDTRANAVGDVIVTVDPAPATADLRPIRAAIKQALASHLEMRDDERAALSIVPFLALVPKRLLLKVGGGAAGGGVASSNVGMVDPAAARADGTDADYFAMKLLHSNVPTAMMYRGGGRLFLLSGRTEKQVFLSVTAYLPGRSNSKDGWRQELLSILNEFSLTGTPHEAPLNHIPTEESPRPVHGTSV
ncbi:hypothetical protein A5707_13975 [Mycobacterium kyorinense]|uniref:Diacylglycerol O-acyltransferase n=1 Tax=Mycobacterium kyorinense TaxID=487514 RepID=A0A1A2ZR87_9MYCO|nr:hypothetical protein [Mycobacterium kyorinense]OBI51581.1 hypothetical protein A5707_13975 [Mycobacterium kyorinense]